MTTNADVIMRYFQLLDKRVIDRTTAEDYGKISELWLDLRSHQVEGITCQAGLLGHQTHYFTWTQLDRIGDESVVVNLPAGLQMQKPDLVKSVVGYEVWTEAGDRVGTVRDYRIHPETGAVIDYLFLSSGWRGLLDDTYCLPSRAVISAGSKRLLAMESAVESATQYDGLTKVVAQFSDFLRRDYSQTRREIAAALESTKAIAGQWQLTQKAVEQVKLKLTDAQASLSDLSQPHEQDQALPPSQPDSQDPGSSDQTS